MPELPEVKTSAKLINEDIKGKKLIDVIVNVDKLIKEVTVTKFKKSIINNKVIKVDNVAKFLVFHFTNNIVMLSHMRMEGKYRFQKNDEFKKHDHVIFKFQDGYLVYSDTRKFGTFHIRTEDNFKKINPIKKLGPFPSPIVFDEVNKKIRKKITAIKTTLLDQTIISGLGNIYVDEVLWKSKIHPQVQSNKITDNELKVILKNSEEILNKATKENGSSIKTYLAYNKIKGNYQNFLNVHTKENHECPRCKTLITKLKVNGRGTYICASCQIIKN